MSQGPEVKRTADKRKKVIGSEVKHIETFGKKYRYCIFKWNISS
jgi:hypothetical protein